MGAILYIFFLLEYLWESAMMSQLLLFFCEKIRFSKRHMYCASPVQKCFLIPGITGSKKHNFWHASKVLLILFSPYTSTTVLYYRHLQANSGKWNGKFLVIHFVLLPNQCEVAKKSCHTRNIIYSYLLPLSIARIGTRRFYFILFFLRKEKKTRSKIPQKIKLKTCHYCGSKAQFGSIEFVVHMLCYVMTAIRC